MPEERGLYPKTPAQRQLTYLARLHGIGRSQAADKARSWLERFGLGERLCDAVAIIHTGRLVAAGSVAGLRVRRDRPLLRVEVDAPHGVDWAGGLSGVEVLAVRNGGALLANAANVVEVDRGLGDAGLARAGDAAVDRRADRRADG